MIGQHEEAVRRIEAVWRIESARIVGTLARVVGDFETAEDLAQDALADAMTQWPVAGVPENPGAWLTAVAKRKAIDGWRRRERQDQHYGRMAHGLLEADDSEWQPIADDVMRLIFAACHPVLARDAQLALTLRVVGGLSSEQIARAFLVPTATIQQRIVRAKKTLAAARVPFEVPEPTEWLGRVASVLGTVYLMFNEGYSATSGEEWMRPELSREALRIGRVLAGLLPREPEVHGLVALMEFQASRFGARLTRTGEPITLDDQDRTRWDRPQILRGVNSLRRADAVGRGRGAYSLQAAIAECHATAATFERTDWPRIVLLYEALGQLAPNPIVDLNRAVAVSMAVGPASGLRIVEQIAGSGALADSYLLPAIRGELLARLGRHKEARDDFETAASRTGNDRERAVLLAKASSESLLFQGGQR